MSKLSLSLRRLRPFFSVTGHRLPQPIRSLFIAPAHSSPSPSPSPSPDPSPWTSPMASECSGILTWRPKTFTDYHHFVVVVKPNWAPDTDTENIIQIFVKTLAQIVGSEEDARKRIYSMSLKGIYAFGARVPGERFLDIYGLPNVVRVAPDAYVDEQNQVFGILDIASKDEQWEQNSGIDRGDHDAERMIRYIRLQMKYNGRVKIHR